MSEPKTEAAISEDAVQEHFEQPALVAEPASFWLALAGLGQIIYPIRRVRRDREVMPFARY